jgi:hypothetical protein
MIICNKPISSETNSTTTEKRVLDADDDACHQCYGYGLLLLQTELLQKS